MPKVIRKNEIAPEKLRALIATVDNHILATQKEMQAAQKRFTSSAVQYPWGIEMLEQAYGTIALQPKIHGLLGFHMFCMLEKRAALEDEKDRIDQWVLETGYIILKLISDF